MLPIPNKSYFSLRRFTLWLLLASITWISGCSDHSLTPLNEQAVIVAFGDSLTAGTGASKGRDYPSVLEQLSGIQIINSGISGETTSEGLLRFQSVLDQYSPDLVILLEGGNDILRNQSAKTTKNNLKEMVQTALAQEIQVVLIGVPEKKLFSSSAPFYAEIADEFDLVFEKSLLSDLLRQSQYKSDPVHLNNAGYTQLATGIYDSLVENGAL